MTQTILANARLVLPDEVVHGAIRIQDGQITAIDTGNAVPHGALDCEGDLVMPGLIELHTDNLERHIEPRPRVNWPHASAIIAHDAELSGVGITTVFDALRVGSVVSKAKGNYGEYARALADEILDLRRDGALKISHFLHLRAETCSETLIEERITQSSFVSSMQETVVDSNVRYDEEIVEGSYVSGGEGAVWSDNPAVVAYSTADDPPDPAFVPTAEDTVFSVPSEKTIFTIPGGTLWSGFAS